MGCCCGKAAPPVSVVTDEDIRNHVLSKQRNPLNLTVLDTPSYIRHSHLTVTNKQGLKLYVQCWLPGLPPVAPLDHEHSASANATAGDNGAHPEEAKSRPNTDVTDDAAGDAAAVAVADGNNNAGDNGSGTNAGRPNAGCPGNVTQAPPTPLHVPNINSSGAVATVHVAPASFDASSGGSNGAGIDASADATGFAAKLAAAGVGGVIPTAESESKSAGVGVGVGVGFGGSVDDNDYGSRRDLRVKGCIVALHGLNTHFGYTFADHHYGYPASIMAQYNANGYAVYGCDHQGHGKSDGAKPREGDSHVGWVRSFDDIAMDVWHIVTELVEKRHPGVPVIIHGHCMGGAHALRALQLVPAPKRPACFAGVILSAPSYMVPPEAKPSKAVLAALGCLSCCAPTMVVADWPDRDDPGSDLRFYTDRFCTSTPFSAHYANQLQKLYGRLATSYTSLDMPLLLAQGAKDSFVRPQDTRHLFDNAVSRCKRMILVSDMEHGLLHDDGCGTLFKHELEWCDAVLALRANQPGAQVLPERSEITISALGGSDGGSQATMSFKAAARHVRSTVKWRRSARNKLSASLSNMLLR